MYLLKLHLGQFAAGLSADRGGESVTEQISLVSADTVCSCGRGLTDTLPPDSVCQGCGRKKHDL